MHRIPARLSSSRGRAAFCPRMMGALAIGLLSTSLACDGAPEKKPLPPVAPTASPPPASRPAAVAAAEAAGSFAFQVQKVAEPWKRDRATRFPRGLQTREVGQDGSAYMNRRMTWDFRTPDQHAAWQQKAAPATSQLELPKGAGPVINNPLGWLDVEAKFDDAAFAWMKPLFEMRLWDPTGANSYHQAFPDEPLVRSGLPKNVGVLRSWGILRLHHGLTAQKPLDALKEVRGLVRLLWSTEREEARVVAIDLLHAERKLTERTKAKWPAMSEAEVQRLRRLLEVGKLLYRAPAAEGTAAIETSTFAGHCSLLGDALTKIQAERAALEPVYKARLDELGGLLAKKSNCRLTGLRAQWNKWPSSTSPAKATAAQQTAAAAAVKKVAIPVDPLLVYGIKKNRAPPTRRPPPGHAPPGHAPGPASQPK